MIVPTTTPCPICKHEGRTEMLQYEPGVDKFCSKNHHFPDAAAIKAAQAAPPAPTPAAEPEPKQAVPEPALGKPTLLDFTPPPAGAAEVIARVPQPTEPVPAALPEPPKTETMAPAPVVAAAPHSAPARGILSPLEKMAKYGYREVAGGDVIMEVRIPERCVESLKEAALRYYPMTVDGTAFRTHIQDVMDRAIQLGWAD
jgi:hypothetical protein